MNMIEGVRLPANVMPMATNLLGYLSRARAEQDAMLIAAELMGMVHTLHAMQRLNDDGVRKLGAYIQRMSNERVRTLGQVR